MVFRASEPVLLPVNYPANKDEFIAVEAESRYLLKLTALRKILNPFEDTPEFSPPYLQEIAPLVQTLTLFPALIGSFPWALLGTVQQGYFLVKNKAIESALNAYLPIIANQLRETAPSVTWCTNYEEWKRRIDLISPSLWPLRAGGLRRGFGTITLIDVAGASQAILHCTEFDRSPIIGNIRADAFELQCQEIINKSAWRPETDLSKVRGKTLRRNGKQFTDIDAIGSKSGILLLVSCKSLIYDRDYDKGNFQSVRNSQAIVDKAVLDWGNFVNQLRSQPAGDNFDFSSFTNIIGVVCTPFVVYSSNNMTCSFIAEELRACVSAIELREWLGETKI